VIELAPRVHRHHADDAVLDPQWVAGERDDLVALLGPLVVKVAGAEAVIV
jgi:hypothetical protein